MKWLDEMQRQVLSEFRSIWKGHSEATDQWFERTCAPAIIEEISEVLKQRRSQARQVEMHRLDQKALAEVWTGLADALPSTNLHGATGPKPNESSGKDPGPVAEVEPELIRFRVSRNARRGLKQSSRSETGINMSCSVTAAGAQDRTKDLGWFGRARGRYSKGRNRLPVETQPQRAQPSSRVRIRSPKRLTAWEIPILPMGTSHFPHGNFPLFLS